MALEQREVGDLIVGLDRTLCVGFGDCVAQAPEAFCLDGEGLARFVRPEATDRARLLRACTACPVDALTVCDRKGNQLVP